MAEPPEPAESPEIGRDAAKHLVLGVGGGIAAYKVCELLRRLTETGFVVRVVPTSAALRFVGAATWEALSGHRVTTTVFDDVDQVAHVRIGKQADLVVIAPATADLIARAAAGRADDLLTATLLTARCPILFVPAMHTEMWEHPATQANVAALRARGALVVEPAVGRLTGADSGPGRLPEPGEIFAVANEVMRRSTHGLSLDLAGRRVVVSAGGTREYLDPVRFLGNRSSGRQGYALATAAVSRGADVTVVAANIELPDPAGAKVVQVTSAIDLHDAMQDASHGADAIVMAAAPADFRPVEQLGHKIKKRPDGQAPQIGLVENPDILVSLVRSRANAGLAGQVIVGFAAETGDNESDVLTYATEKLRRKGCDLLVVNDVSGGRGFGAEHNQAVILAADGSSIEVPDGPKLALAHTIWDCVKELWERSG
jgi:phosphopantothenoylcysteine decarboxylase/phosphopantothenate--cysteine ligase